MTTKRTARGAADHRHLKEGTSHARMVPPERLPRSPINEMTPSELSAWIVRTHEALEKQDEGGTH